MSGIKVEISFRRGLLAISPIVVFLVVYLVTSIICGDFYKMPISVALLIASVWAAFTMKGKPLSDRIAVFSQEAGSSNVLYMVWIFILAGAFAAIARKTGAIEATVDLTIRLLPSYMLVPGLFIATCFISMAIGTSVGTVVALTPLASEMAIGAGASVPFFVAIVLGGAFFGDNLSFISDTTIAATRTQGCDMKDKFTANLAIVLPAALIALVLYCLASPSINIEPESSGSNYWLIIPYLVVILFALCGINVTVVLLLGILSALVAGLLQGMTLLDIFSTAGEGIESVGGLIIVTLLAAGMLGMIKSAGGIDFILKVLGRNINTSRGAQFSIALLVGIVNLCTANNTIAIITVGSVAKKIAGHYGISPKKSASLLDTASCITQALIPYGAQTLMAASLSGISPVEPWQYLFYPQILIICLGVSILITKKLRPKES
ncbi:MAG: Na+/H+ antiporter NhaC family protein [Muribaculaceae bacterium]|nr:Na+/H+ antiporter NhaC family protein [Muribaculaceae bacterium]